MSVAQCDCGVLVDTDYDDEYYGEDGSQEGSCKGCRERFLIRQIEEERLDERRYDRIDRSMPPDEDEAYDRWRQRRVDDEKPDWER